MVDNIKTDFGKKLNEGGVWTGLAQDKEKWLAFVNAVISLSFIKNSNL
jgi:hypothetical protein